MTSPLHPLVVFTLDEHWYALHLSAVERIVRAAEVTSLPKTPEIVLGVINVQGRVFPVVNIRKRFGLPEREMELSDVLILARTSRRAVALVADAVRGLIQRSQEEVVAAEAVVPGMKYLDGLAKFEDGLILIHDLDTFLNLEEERALEAAMAGGKGEQK